MSAPGFPKALGVSAAAHALLLGSLLLATPPPAPKSPLALRFLTLESASVAVSGEGRAEGPRASFASPPAPPERLWRRRPRPQLVAVAEAEAPGVPSRLLRLAEPDEEGTAPPSAPVDGQKEDAPAFASGGAGAASGGGGPPEGLHGARLSELHRRLEEAAQRCYPEAARRFRLRGEVPLHFCLDAAGAATALSLEGSTGSSLLDRSALECVVPGAQPLSGFEGCFLVAVRFGG